VIPASIDLTPFTSLITLVLGGGLALAYATWRKTPVEIESITVSTLRGTVETLSTEVERLNRENGELRRRIEQLERIS
jgi:lipid-A-disaccharide synthase-like uncharacterized protein